MSSETKAQEPGAGCGCLAPLAAAGVTALVGWAVVGASPTALAAAALAGAMLAGLFMVIGESGIEDAIKVALVWVVAFTLIAKGPPAVDAMGVGLLVGPVLGSLANRVVERARRRDAASAQSTGSATS